MVAISFSLKEDFPEMIRQGIKDQTIRPLNEKRFEQIKRIRKLQLYWKQRTKECYKIADAELTEIFKMMFKKVGITTFFGKFNEKTQEYELMGFEESWNLAIRDGFNSIHEMIDAFYETYGEKMYEMEFMVIRFKVEEIK